MTGTKDVLMEENKDVEVSNVNAERAASGSFGEMPMDNAGASFEAGAYGNDDINTEVDGNVDKSEDGNLNVDKSDESNLNTDGAEDENLQKSGKGKAMLKEVISWIAVILIALVLAHILTRYVIMKAQVPTGSMLDTIQIKDKLIGNRLAYLFDDPERGDIIIFPCPDNGDEYIKRVIGLPGEKVIIHNVEGTDHAGVYIDVNADGKPDENELLEESYIKEGMELVEADEIYNVPEGCYFVMGDNRNHSADSRKWYTTNYVKKENIDAKAWFRYSPSIEKYKAIDYNIGE